MTRFRLGQRVLVHAYDHDDKPITPPARGQVVRLRRNDEAAWIELDDRRDDISFPFPEGDVRERHVMAFPQVCEPAVILRARGGK